MKYLSFSMLQIAVAGAACIWAGPASAGIIRVPADQANIYNAISAANTTGDEIRVANTYLETEAFVELTNKQVTIRSFSPDYSTPQAGARWESFTDGDIYSSLLTISNGGLVIEGFTAGGSDCNVFYLKADSSLTVRDCILTGTKRADTAAIKSVFETTLSPNVNNISINVEGTTVTDNGRAIWTRGNTGTTSLTIKDSVFVNNSSYVVMWEPYAGTHSVDFTDNKLQAAGISTAARGYRFLAHGAPAASLVTANLNFERNYFTTTSNGRAVINLAGINASTYDAASTFTTTIRNCVFDLTAANDQTDTVAFSSEGASSVRKSDIKMDHCTVVLNGTNKSGIRLNENQSNLEVSNCIFDGNGQGRVAYRSLLGKTISNKNLVNVAGVSGNIYETQAGGSVELSGSEIVGQPAQFTDLANKNYTLASTSPALAVGEDLGITVDIVGNARPNPVGSLPDLGAYERGVNPSAVNDWAVY